jgi:hypothetical protein
MATVETLKRAPIVLTELPGKRQKSFGNSSSDEDFDPNQPQEVPEPIPNKFVDLEELFPPKLVLPPNDERWSKMIPTVPAFLNDSKAPNILIQTPADLDTAINILPMHAVFGLLEFKDLLLTRIAVPIASPDLFGFHKAPGMPIQHNFFFFGRHGSGKRSLIRSFCQDRGITLCEAFAPGFIPLEELVPLYEAACKNSPSIVLLNDCDAIFMKNSPNVAPLWRILKDIRERGLPVWTIFRSQFKQDILDNILQDMLSYSVWAGVPSPVDRERLWCTALMRYNQNNLPLLNELKMLCELSDNCTPRNIYSFVECSMADKVANLGLDLSLYPRDHVQMQLTIKDLKFVTLNGSRRITQRNPQEENVASYLVPVAADNPKFNPHNRNVKQGTWT